MQGYSTAPWRHVAAACTTGEAGRHVPVRRADTFTLQLPIGARAADRGKINFIDFDGFCQIEPTFDLALLLSVMK
ncbi:MAG TPA: hypothetical protein VGJ87_06675 [Roseiflexaceae bacterium]|jgi:hypothetical protein